MGDGRDQRTARLHDAGVKIDGEALGQRVASTRPGDVQDGAAVALVRHRGEAGQGRAQAGFEAMPRLAFGGG